MTTNSGTQASPLGPIDPISLTATDNPNVTDAETEKSAPWIVRKLAGVSDLFLGVLCGGI